LIIAFFPRSKTLADQVHEPSIKHKLARLTDHRHRTFHGLGWPITGGFGG